MLNCLDDIVVLADTCQGGTGLVSLQTLGINESFLASITDNESGPQKLLTEVREWAKVKLRNDAINYHARNIVSRTFVDRGRIGALTDDETMITADANTVGGIVIEVNNPQSNLIIRIGNVSYFGNTTGVVTFTIYDLSDGHIAGTYTITGVANTNVSKAIQLELPVHREMKRYFITHDQLTFRDLDMDGAPGSACCGACEMKYGGVYAYGARIGAAQSKRYSNIQRTTNTSGMSIVLTLECDHDQWLCETSHLLTAPYLYLIGQGIMARALGAVDRINNVTANRELYEQRLKEYEVEYDTTKNNIFGNMQVPGDRMCFSCKRTISHSIELP